jgi:nicotinamidase/pyrazinamidase
LRALLLVDIQNDFLPGGALAVPRGDEVVAVANRLVGRFDLVVASQDWHPPEHRSFASNHASRRPGDVIDLDGLEQVLWPDHCVQGTAGAELAPGLELDRVARVFRKGTDPAVDSYSAFFDNGRRNATGLGAYLERRGVEELYVLGLATDYCVRFTALDAARLGLPTTVIEDGCRAVEREPGDGERALQELERAGVRRARSDELWAGARASGAADGVLRLGQGHFLRLVSRGGWESVERVGSSGVVAIVAVTAQRELILVEQYRPAVGRNVIELPAGLVGDHDGGAEEDERAAAERELLEETGYAADHFEYLTEGPSSAGMSSERIVFYRAVGLRRDGPGGGDDSEDIRVHHVPLERVTDWLRECQRRDADVDPKVFAGLHFALVGGGSHS